MTAAQSPSRVGIDEGDTVRVLVRQCVSRGQLHGRMTGIQIPTVLDKALSFCCVRLARIVRGLPRETWSPRLHTPWPVSHFALCLLPCERSSGLGNLGGGLAAAFLMIECTPALRKPAFASAHRAGFAGLVSCQPRSGGLKRAWSASPEWWLSSDTGQVGLGVFVENHGKAEHKRQRCGPAGSKVATYWASAVYSHVCGFISPECATV